MSPSDTMSMPLDAGLDRYDEAEERALARVVGTGLSLRTAAPKLRGSGEYFDGRVPTNLGSVSPAEIGEYYGLMVEYTDYAEGQTVLARAEMLSAEAKLDLVRAAVRKSKVGTAQDKGDLALIDVRYVEANANYIEARTYFELISAIGDAARRDVKFVSRVIETKKMELEMGGRGGSLSRVPNNEREGANRFRTRRRE